MKQFQLKQMQSFIFCLISPHKTSLYNNYSIVLIFCAIMGLLLNPELALKLYLNSNAQHIDVQLRQTLCEMPAGKLSTIYSHKWAKNRN